MNQMARESIWYISCLVLQLLWNRRWNEQRVLEDEPVIDPIIEPQTWMNFIWNIVNRNAGITAFSAMLLGKWTLIAIWRLIKQRLMNMDGRVVTTPTMFHEGMNVNKWLREFEEYADKSGCNEPDRRARELLKYLDENCGRIVKKSLKHDDDKQKMYYPAFRQQMVLLFVTTKIKQRDAKLKLYSREQNEDESITRYYYELMNLAKDAFPGIDQSVLDAYIHEQFLHGIRNPEVKRKLVHDHGKASELQDVVRVAKLYEEEEEERESKFDRKERKERKEHKIKKVFYQSDDSTDYTSEEEEVKIRRFEKRQINGRSNRNEDYRRNRSSRDYSTDRHQRSEREKSEIPAKHYNEEQDSKNTTPKKSVNVNEKANVTYDSSAENNVEDRGNEEERRCFTCEGMFHISRECPFRYRSRHSNSAYKPSQNNYQLQDTGRLRERSKSAS